MESPKYLIIITLIDGQNFTVPDGAPDKIEASVFAEARFGNESILKSDPIKLTNSNPEFVTELAWQLDKKSLHQLRVERRAIKLQVFMQTRERKRNNRQSHEQASTNGFQSNDSSATNKIELIGYTVLDIRSAQERAQPKFQWLPLLNPKFRKSSYNRPEVQLAVTLSRIDDSTGGDDLDPPCTSNSAVPFQKKVKDDCLDWQSESHESEDIDAESYSNDNSKLYKTCLDISLEQDQVEKDEIIENDIQIKSKDGCFYIYDTRDPDKSTMNDCDERYRVTVTIPFNSNLDDLMKDLGERYYFSICLFGASQKTENFVEPNSVETKEVKFKVFTTHPSILTTYFELNSSLIIRLHRQGSEESLGIADIQLDQLCSLDSKRRSIEGIFTLQSMRDYDIPTAIQPSIGVSVVLERIVDEPIEQVKLVSEEHIEMAREHFGQDIDDYLFKSFNDTHQLTYDDTNFEDNYTMARTDNGPIEQEDHHFCFTIDLKNFSYTPNQRLIPTLRELVVRYSYPFFGYKDTITTDASIPISPTNSIIVSGFCEFNFATTLNSLVTALNEIPLDLEILTCDQAKRLELSVNQAERIVATCNLNLAQTMNISTANIGRLHEEAISVTVSAPIHELGGVEIGELQIYLCLKDLGRPEHSNLKPSIENVGKCANDVAVNPRTVAKVSLDNQRLDNFIEEAKNSLESWKESFMEKLSEEARKRENERFKRLCQRFEAREAKREHEFRKKMDELTNLEKRLKNSFAYLESLERRLSNSFEQLKTKDTLLDTRLDTLDLKISKAINDIKLEYERRVDSCRQGTAGKFQRCLSDETPTIETKAFTRTSSKPISETFQTRRSSLRNTGNVAGIPVPVRSSSLVNRGPIEGSSMRLVKRPMGVVTTVINGISSRPRSNSTRLNLPKEIQEKLTCLRREKAELLKRGCRPNDELIQEINSLIEKLAC